MTNIQKILIMRNYIVCAVILFINKSNKNKLVYFIAARKKTCSKIDLIYKELW